MQITIQVYHECILKPKVALVLDEVNWSEKTISWLLSVPFPNIWQGKNVLASRLFYSIWVRAWGPLRPLSCLKLSGYWLNENLRPPSCINTWQLLGCIWSPKKTKRLLHWIILKPNGHHVVLELGVANTIQ
jgi:hypothetical protein